MKLVIDNGIVKHCLVCGVTYIEQRKYNRCCFRKGRHMWSKHKARGKEGG